jgi:hypothetical protein
VRGVGYRLRDRRSVPRMEAAAPQIQEQAAVELACTA